jgi:hypothetical protein
MEFTLFRKLPVTMSTAERDLGVLTMRIPCPTGGCSASPSQKIRKLHDVRYSTIIHIGTAVRTPNRTLIFRTNLPSTILSCVIAVVLSEIVNVICVCSVG